MFSSGPYTGLYNIECEPIRCIGAYDVRDYDEVTDDIYKRHAQELDRIDSEARSVFTEASKQCQIGIERQQMKDHVGADCLFKMEHELAVREQAILERICTPQRRLPDIEHVVRQRIRRAHRDLLCAITAIVS